MEFNIPLEIKDKSAFPQLKKVDRQIICAAVLMGLSNQEAFKLYHPEYLTADGRLNDAGKKASTMHWNYGKVKDYRQTYEEELAEYLGLCKRVGSKADLSEELSEERKDSALKSLLNKALALVERGGELDPDTLKTIADLFKRLGVLKDEVETVESPRRYLPTRCGECAYRSFVESYVETGEIENACLRCKALKVAQEHGFRYDPKDLLRPNDEKTTE